MLEGIIGVIVFFIAIIATHFAIRLLVDLFIALLTLGGIGFIMLSAMNGTYENVDQLLLTSAVLGIGLSIITIPLWPYSATFEKMTENSAETQSTSR